MQVNVNSMNAHVNWLNSNANNIANVNTKDHNATRTVLENNTQSSVEAVNSKTNKETNLSKELTNQIPIEKGFDAQVKAIKTQEEMMGGILNILA